MDRPDPEGAADLNDLVARLRLLKACAGDPSYAVITRRINAAWAAAGRPESELTRRSTVAGYFSAGRSRLDEELPAAIARTLSDDSGYAERWRVALRRIRGHATAACWVESAARLPAERGRFVGRRDELDRLPRADGATVVVSAIHGMAGIGKTTLAVHAAHRLLAEGRYTDVQLFVDLRGFDDEAPPADPAAVLAGFLRHLGVPGDRIPATIEGRVARYRKLLRGRRALVVRAALTLSDRHLPADLRQALRLLSLHPGPDWDAHAAAALTGQPVPVARARLDALATANLIRHRAPDRYEFHDLVRAFAHERAAVDEPARRTRAAVTRLLDHYRYAAAVAVDTLYPAEKRLRPVVVPAEPAEHVRGSTPNTPTSWPAPPTPPTTAGPPTPSTWPA